jgi:DcmR-like sensory protein
MARAFTESVVHGTVASRHIAQLFDSMESRVEAVSSFVTDALSRQHHVMVLAKASNWAAIADELDGRGCSAARAQRNGSLTVVDARQALEAIGADGYPSSQLFNSLIGGEISRLSAAGGLAVYGELVEILAERADFGAAVHLEELWNQLLERCSFTLLCGYSAAHFVGRPGDNALHRVCAVHGGIHSSDDDPLGQWILRTH